MLLLRFSGHNTSLVLYILSLLLLMLNCWFFSRHKTTCKSYKCCWCCWGDINNIKSKRCHCCCCSSLIWLNLLSDWPALLTIWWGSAGGRRRARWTTSFSSSSLSSTTTSSSSCSHQYQDRHYQHLDIVNTWIPSLPSSSSSSSSSSHWSHWASILLKPLQRRKLPHQPSCWWMSLNHVFSIEVNPNFQQSKPQFSSRRTVIYYKPESLPNAILPWSHLK